MFEAELRDLAVKLGFGPAQRPSDGFPRPTPGSRRIKHSTVRCTARITSQGVRRGADPPRADRPGTDLPPQRRRVVTAVPGPKSVELMARRARPSRPVRDRAAGLRRAGRRRRARRRRRQLADRPRLGHRGHQRRQRRARGSSRAVAEQAARFTHTCFMITPYEGYVEVCEQLNRLTPGDAREAVDAGQLRRRGGGERGQGRPGGDRPAGGGRLRPRLPRADAADDDADREVHAVQGGLRAVRAGGLPGADGLPVPRGRAGRTGARTRRTRGRRPGRPPRSGPTRWPAWWSSRSRARAASSCRRRASCAGLADFCAAHGVLLVADEVQTGFGRTGDWFACEHEGIEPDLVTTAKGIAGGLPLGGVTGRAELMDAVPVVRAGRHLRRQPGGLRRGARAPSSMIEREDLVGRARRIGELALPRLRALAARHPAIGDVRGRGAMLAVELVRARRPDARPGAAARTWCRRCAAAGVVVLTAGTYGNVLRLLPPLVMRRGPAAGRRWTCSTPRSAPRWHDRGGGRRRPERRPRAAGRADRARRRRGSPRPIPAARALHERARRTMPAGVPMSWMAKWAGGFPIASPRRPARTSRCLDGIDHVDLCLGDTGAMAGHSPAPTVAAVARAGGARDHHDAARRGRRRGRRGAGPPVRRCRPGSSRCRRPTPTGTCCGTRGTSPAGAGCGDRLLLPRHGRRGVRDAGRRPGGRPRAATSARRCRPPRPPSSCRSTTSPRSSARWPAATWPALLAEPAMTNIGIVLPEPGWHAGAARADPRGRHAAGAGRDAHAVRRAGRRDRRRRARAGRRGGRQGDRRRGAGRRVRPDRRARRPDPGARSSWRTSTSAASAARWPATRCRWPATRATLAEVLTDAAFARMTSLGRRWDGRRAGVLARPGCPGT